MMTDEQRCSILRSKFKVKEELSSAGMMLKILSKYKLLSPEMVKVTTNSTLECILIDTLNAFLPKVRKTRKNIPVNRYLERDSMPDDAYILPVVYEAIALNLEGQSFKPERFTLLSYTIKPANPDLDLSVCNRVHCIKYVDKKITPPETRIIEIGEDEWKRIIIERYPP